MSSLEKHKMYNYEVTPPDGIWNKIAAELDNGAYSNKFPSTLYNIEIAAPVTVWEKIANRLDDSLFADEFSTKLNNAEVTPPTGNWNKIKALLDEQSDTGKRKIFPILRYAAAAAVIGLIAWGGFQLFNSKSNEPDIAVQKVFPVNPDTIKSETIQTDNSSDQKIATTDIPSAEDEARNDAALEASKKTYAKLDVATRSKIKNAADFYFTSGSESAINTRGLNVEPVASNFSESGNRYIVLMTPDGNIIRMSKKLGNLVCCVSGQQEDFECVNKIKKWREQIANSASNHSPGNFMDILSLVNSLQENQQN